MKTTILLDTDIISLYISKHKEIQSEIQDKIKSKFRFIASELNYIELFSHLCKKKGKINAQIIMENLRRENVINFLSVDEKISLLVGELKCKYSMLSMVDSVIISEALIKNIPLYTTETRFNEIDNLKVKKIYF